MHPHMYLEICMTVINCTKWYTNKVKNESTNIFQRRDLAMTAQDDGKSTILLPTWKSVNCKHSSHLTLEVASNAQCGAYPAE